MLGLFILHTARSNLATLCAALFCVLLISLSAPAGSQTSQGAIGIAEREWRQALAYMRGNRPRAALPILERLAVAAPDSLGVQSELGIAYARSFRDQQALAQLNRALALAETEAQRHVLQRAIRSVENRNPFSGSISFGIAPETNITRRSSIDSITIGPYEFFLNETVDSGTGLTFNSNLTYAPMIAPDLRVSSAVSFNGRLFRDNQFNDYRLRLSTGLEFLGDRDRVIGFGVLHDRRWSGDRRFSRDLGIYATGQIRANPQTLLFTRVELARRKVPVLPRRDGTVQRLSFGVSHALSRQTHVTGRISGTRTRAQEAFESGRFIGLSVGVAHGFESGWQTRGNLSLTHERRDGPTAISDVRRKDYGYRVSLAITNRNYVYRGFSPTLEIGTERRNSNNKLNQFNNQFIGLSITRGF